MDDFAEYRHFRFLDAIVRHGGFRAAAQALHTSQPSMSRQIREFQEHYGLKLFRRLKNGGMEFLPAARAIPIVFKQLQESFDEALTILNAIQRGETKELRLGCTPFVDSRICAKAAALHRALIPGGNVKVVKDNAAPLLDDLLADRLDTAIVSLPVADDRLRAEVICRERLVACLPADHSLATKTMLTGRDLSENLRVFLRPAQHPAFHAQLLEVLAELGVQFEERAYTAHPHDLLETVKNGEGFALIREGTPLIDGVITRPILGVAWTVDTAVVFKRDPEPKVTVAIAKELRKIFLPSSAPGATKKGPMSVRESQLKSKPSKSG